jgi:hypothetical protein
MLSFVFAYCELGSMLYEPPSGHEAIISLLAGQSLITEKGLAQDTITHQNLN